MTIDQVRQTAKHLVSIPDSTQMFRIFPQFMTMLETSREEFIQFCTDALFANRAEMLGLTEDELIEFGIRIGSAPLKKAIAAKVSPEKKNLLFQSIGEMAAPAITTTANTAPYIVPIGSAPSGRKDYSVYSSKKTKLLKRSGNYIAIPSLTKSK